MGFDAILEIFLPVFVAMSPLTILPIFLSMSDGMPNDDARKLARHAIVTGASIAAVLVIAGQALFRFLSITVDDLRVAGGIILLIIAIYDLIFSNERRKTSSGGLEAGVVPLGTPLIVGPATMTAAVVLADTHGRIPTILVLFVNLFGIWLMLHHADKLKKYLNPAVSRAFGKVMSLFLAAIAVAMFRGGIAGFIKAR